MPGIIFTRYDNAPPTRDDARHADLTGRPSGRIDRRRFIGGISALAAAASLGRLLPADAALAQATPPATDAAGPVAALTALLQATPASLVTDAANGVLFYHADLAAQFAACGVDRTAADWLSGTNLYAVTAALALVSAGFQYGASPDFAAALGFTPLQVDRAVEIGGPPNALSIYQGGLDRVALEAAWAKTGFTQVALDGGRTLWTLGEEGEIDPASPIAQFGAGAFNNLLLLDDQTLLVSRMGEPVRAAAAHAASGDAAASVLGIAGVPQAIATLSPTVVSTIGLSGRGLAGSPRPDAATPVAPGAMPEIAVALFGIEAGARGEIDATGATPAAGSTAEDTGTSAQVEVRLVTASRADAETAATTAASRWGAMRSQVTQQPFAELMTLVSSGVSEVEETVAAIDFASGPTPGRWIQLVAMQDLAPFAPGGN